jgi:hypothetical protein
MRKVAEKIMTTRLSYLDSNILNFDQLDGRKQFFAIDAVLSLVHDIQANKSEKLITSALFIDVKEVFDHVSANRLLKICQELGLPKSTIQGLNVFLKIDQFNYVLIMKNKKNRL